MRQKLLSTDCHCKNKNITLGLTNMFDYAVITVPRGKKFMADFSSFFSRKSPF